MKLAKEILEEAKVCSSHGYDHAVAVLKHGMEAVLVQSPRLTEQQILIVLLACLLHDINDRKFFPVLTDHENERKILAVVLRTRPDAAIVTTEVLEAISLVSCSVNGDNIPENVRSRLYLLIPRYCDRLEALGEIGLQRCHKYAQTVGNPLAIPEDLRAVDEKDLWERVATPAAYKAYVERGGTSKSVVGHCGEKLLPMSSFPKEITNPYLRETSEQRRAPLIAFMLEFGKLGETSTIDDAFVKRFYA